MLNFTMPTMPSVALTALITVTLLILADAMLGIILAAIGKTLNPKKLPQFIQNIALYIGGLLVLFALGLYVPDMMAVFLTAAAALTLAYANDIKNKIAGMVKKPPMPVE